MRPEAKYRAIRTNKYSFSIAYLCQFFGVSRSGYYAWLKRIEKPDKDFSLRDQIIECQKKAHNTYGYRRVKIWLEREKGLVVNKKTVLRVMRKYDLLSEVRRPRWFYANNPYRYVSYGNVLQRNFHAQKPNEKWVTDISYILTKQGRLYLSVIKDLYDKSIVAFEMATYLDNRLVLRTIEKAKGKLRNGTIIHSDQGSQYASNDYAKLVSHYKFVPSMSRPGNPLDNAPAESFFSTLKAECIYRHKLRTIAEAKELIKRYIWFYNHERILLESGLTPFEMRFKAA